MIKRFILPTFIFSLLLWNHCFAQSFPGLLFPEDVYPLENSETSITNKHFFSYLAEKYSPKLSDILFEDWPALTALHKPRLTPSDLEEMTAVITEYLQNNPDELNLLNSRHNHAYGFFIQDGNLIELSGYDANQKLKNYLTGLKNKYQASDFTESFQKFKQYLIDKKQKKESSFSIKNFREHAFYESNRIYIDRLLNYYEKVGKIPLGVEQYISYYMLKTARSYFESDNKPGGLKGKIAAEELNSEIGPNLGYKNLNDGLAFIPMSKMDALYRGIAPGECVRFLEQRYLTALRNDVLHFSVLHKGLEIGYIELTRRNFEGTKLLTIETIMAPIENKSKLNNFDLTLLVLDQFQKIAKQEQRLLLIYNMPTAYNHWKPNEHLGSYMSKLKKEFIWSPSYTNHMISHMNSATTVERANENKEIFRETGVITENHLPPAWRNIGLHTAIPHFIMPQEENMIAPPGFSSLNKTSNYSPIFPTDFDQPDYLNKIIKVFNISNSNRESPLEVIMRYILGNHWNTADSKSIPLNPHLKARIDGILKTNKVSQTLKNEFTFFSQHIELAPENRVEESVATIFNSNEITFHANKELLNLLRDRKNLPEIFNYLFKAIQRSVYGNVPQSFLSVKVLSAFLLYAIYRPFDPSDPATIYDDEISKENINNLRDTTTYPDYLMRIDIFKEVFFNIYGKITLGNLNKILLAVLRLNFISTAPHYSLFTNFIYPFMQTSVFEKPQSKKIFFESIDKELSFLYSFFIQKEYFPYSNPERKYYSLAQLYLTLMLSSLREGALDQSISDFQKYLGLSNDEFKQAFPMLINPCNLQLISND